MTKEFSVDDARKAFADLTATLEDLAVLAYEGQSASDITAACRLTGQLIRRLKSCHRLAQLLRRRLR